jgi:sugar O-acyltransferase (sialic acid O-acetyltransferase NeuD family)
LKKVIFWGGTGQAKVLNEALLDSEYKLVAIFDNRYLEKSPVDNIPLFQGMEGLDLWLGMQGFDSQLPLAAVAIGGNKGNDRVLLMDTLKVRGLNPLTIVHHKSFVAKDAKLREGAQILAMASVCSNASIGRATIVNTAASVDHDCVIGDGVHIGPGAHLTGEILIGKAAFIGAGAVVLPRLHIGEGAIIGAGAVVTKNVPPYQTVVGNPARRLLKKLL